MLKHSMVCTCDVCGYREIANDKEEEDDMVKEWIFETEVGDLCPSCKKAWIEHKEAFITRMRKENGCDLI